MPYPSPHEKKLQAQFRVCLAIAFAVAALASIILVRMIGFDGAIYTYLSVMVLLFVMLAAQYVLIRFKR
jgi:hypothetical protein